jgi:hypothetical protein
MLSLRHLIAVAWIAVSPIAIAAACTTTFHADSPDASTADGAPAAPIVRCSGPFENDETVSWLPTNTQSFRFGADGLLYISVKNEAGIEELDAFERGFLPDGSLAPGAGNPKRASAYVAGLNTLDGEENQHPAPFGEGHALAFERSSEAGTGPDRIYVSWRATLDARFPTVSSPLRLEGAPDLGKYEEPYLVGSHVYYAVARTEDGSESIEVGDIDVDAGVIKNPRLIALDVAGNGYPVVTGNELAIYFESKRDAKPEELEERIWFARRASTDASFGSPELAEGIVNEGQGRVYPTWISDDECILYYVRNPPSSIFPASVHRVTRTRKN